jgi:uncharacterized protein
LIFANKVCEFQGKMQGDTTKPMMKIKRELKINKSKSFFLFGPRQVGKSTFLKENFQSRDSLYFNFLLNEEYEKYLLDKSLFRKEVLASKEKKFIILDEIQRIPELLNEVHYLLENMENPPSFILSGSSARKLKRKEANMLGGRALKYEMFPFSYSELKTDFDLENLINYGSLPQIYLEKDPELKRRLLSSYCETYLQEEIRAEALVRNIKGFISFLKIAAENNGEIINFSNIARETGNERASIKEFYQILEDTLLGFFLLSYKKSSRKKLVAHPKFYFFDLGVSKALAKQINLTISRPSSAYGKAFEHFIILEIIKSNRYKQKDWDLSFYRTAAGAEVDLIIEKPDKSLLAIEIKSKNNPEMSELKGLRSFQDLKPEAKLICVSMNSKNYEDKGISFQNWESFLEELCSV